MRIAYFVHDLSDPAVSRRVRMLLAGSAEVTVLGFRRSDKAPHIPGAEVVDLGRTHDGAFVQRIGKVLHAVARCPALKPALAGADVVMARNLEMLLLATVARRLHRPAAGLVYECLDVHRLMVGRGPVGAALRGLERGLMRAAGLLVVSSPAFIDSYFAPRQGEDGRGRLPVLLVENKVLELTAPAASPAAVRPVGPPWRIGWYGAIRCRRSLDLLAQLAARRPDLVGVEIRGRPAYTEFDDFEARVAGVPGLRFGGPYSAQDLADLYGGVHFAWAIDWFEAGANSAWLLPNRVYEGGRYGAVPLALNGVETGRWLAARGLGVLVDDPATRLEAVLEAMTPDRYRALAARAAAAPAADFVAGPDDCRELVQRLAATQRDALSGVDVARPKFDAIGGGMPCPDA